MGKSIEELQVENALLCSRIQELEKQVENLQDELYDLEEEIEYEKVNRLN